MTNKEFNLLIGAVETEGRIGCPTVINQVLKGNNAGFLDKLLTRLNGSNTISGS